MARIRRRRSSQGLCMVNVVGIVSRSGSSPFRSRENSNEMVEGGAHVGELGNTPGNPIVLDSDDEVEEDQSLTPSASEIFCRICFGPEQATAGTPADPIIPVGCHCIGDMSKGHKSCLMRWFQTKLLMNLELGCEVCKGPFGQALQAALLAKHLPIRDQGDMGIAPFNPSELILLQVPMEELDRLQVPINTPPFSTLDDATQDAIMELLSNEERDHAFEVFNRTFQAQRVHCEECVDLPARSSHAREMLSEYIDMVSVTKQPHDEDDDDAKSACFPRNGSPPNIRIILEDDQGQILRVPGRSQQAAVYAVSRELCCHCDVLVTMTETLGENLILLPRLMVVDNVCMDRVLVGPTPSSPSSARGRSSARGGSRRACTRQFTYGQYVIHPLIDFD